MKSGISFRLEPQQWPIREHHRHLLAEAVAECGPAAASVADEHPAVVDVPGQLLALSVGEAERVVGADQQGGDLGGVEGVGRDGPPGQLLQFPAQRRDQVPPGRTEPFEHRAHGVRDRDQLAPERLGQARGCR